MYGGVRYPYSMDSWKQVYLQTALEANAQKIPGRIAATRAAIAERLRHLEPASDHLKEQQDIEKTLNALQVLEAESRNWKSRMDYSAEKWFEVYERAVTELEHAKMRGRIGDARAQIRSRVEKLKDIPGLHSAEHQAIDDALNALKFLEREEDRYGENQRRETLEVASRKIQSLGPKIRKLDDSASG
jgi:hypothetical protein